MKNASDCKELFQLSLIIAKGIFNLSFKEESVSYNEDYKTVDRAVDESQNLETKCFLWRIVCRLLRWFS